MAMPRNAAHAKGNRPEDVQLRKPPVTSVAVSRIEPEHVLVREWARAAIIRVSRPHHEIAVELRFHHRIPFAAVVAADMFWRKVVIDECRRDLVRERRGRESVGPLHIKILDAVWRLGQKG